MTHTLRSIIERELRLRQRGCRCLPCRKLASSIGLEYRCFRCGYVGIPNISECYQAVLSEDESATASDFYECPLCIDGAGDGHQELMTELMDFFWQPRSQTVPSCTASGLPIHYLEPLCTPIVMSDLFAGLKTKQRFDAVIGSSVLFHLALVVKLLQADGHGPLIVKYGGAHDLHEAYSGEWHSGLKQAVPELKQAEDPWEEYLHEYVGLPWPAPADIKAVVKRADILSCTIEMVVWNHPRAVTRLQERGGLTSELITLGIELKKLSPEQLWQTLVEVLELGDRQ